MIFGVVYISTWMLSFLSNRSQRVVLNSQLSEWVPVWSGVPQGSVLGPLLFILYVNDILDLIQGSVRMFADDTKKNFDDNLRLQKDMDCLMQWSHIWVLKFNAAKCKLLKIGNSHPYPCFMLDGPASQPVEIKLVNEEKDWGIWCTGDLKPSLHCQRAAAKAMRVFGLIISSFKLLQLIQYVNLPA